MTWDAANAWSRFADGSLLILWLVKGLQAKDRFDVSNGWSVFDTDPGILVNFPAIASVWNGMSSSNKLQLMNNYLRVWLNKAQAFTPQQWQALGYANATVLIDQSGSQFTTRIAEALPRFRFVGVDPTLVNQLAALA